MKIDKIGPGSGELDKESIPAKKKEFWVLNWLRFILAIYIVLFHTLRERYESIEGTWLHASLGLGNMATSVFFVLSGFLLTYAYVVQKKGREVDRRTFWMARFSTLYPLHIAGFLIALVPMCLTIYARGGISVPVDLTGTAMRMLGHGEFVLALVMNVLLLNAWNPFYLTFNIPSWSLSALAFYYLLFPMLGPKIYRMKSLGIALVLLAVVFALPGIVSDLLQMETVLVDGLLHRNPLVRLPLFIAGIVLCVMYARSRAPGSTQQVVALWAVLVATVTIGMYLQHQESTLHVIRNGLYFPASLAVIWLCACARPIQSSRIRYWGERLGAASLPLFLLHGPMFPLFRAIEKFVKGVIHSPDWSLSSIIAAGKASEATFDCFALYILALVTVCVFVQERFVAPLQVGIRNRAARRRLVALEQQKSRTGTD